MKKSDATIHFNFTITKKNCDYITKFIDFAKDYATGIRFPFYTPVRQTFSDELSLTKEERIQILDNLMELKKTIPEESSREV